MSPNSEGWASAKPAEAPHGRAVYRFGTAIIEVGIDDHEVALWLEEFLTPWFSAEAPGQTGFHVRMTVSKERFATLVRREAESSLRPLACFGLDSALVSYPGWIEADGTTIVADEEFCCYYRVGDNLVEVVARPQDRQARIGLMRVVRELAALCTLARPEILDLHAAAFVFRGRAVLLAGDKKAGKTTLLAHALASRQAALLANDRVIVEESQLQAHGVPTVVAVRGGRSRDSPLWAAGFPGAPPCCTRANWPRQTPHRQARGNAWFSRPRNSQDSWARASSRRRRSGQSCFPKSLRTPRPGR